MKICIDNDLTEKGKEIQGMIIERPVKLSFHSE